MFDLAEIPTIDALHAALAKKLRFPGHYGRNLDALHDVLTESVAKRKLVFRGCAAFWHGHPEFFPRFVQVLMNAQDESEGLLVEFEP